MVSSDKPRYVKSLEQNTELCFPEILLSQMMLRGDRDLVEVNE